MFIHRYIFLKIICVYIYTYIYTFVLKYVGTLLPVVCHLLVLFSYVFIHRGYIFGTSLIHLAHAISNSNLMGTCWSDSGRPRPASRRGWQRLWFRDGHGWRPQRYVLHRDQTRATYSSLKHVWPCLCNLDCLSNRKLIRIIWKKWNVN